jgi:hypothetical protein
MIITDAASLIDGGMIGQQFFAPIVINTIQRTITITPGSGILPNTFDGVTGQALYSALKLLWKNSSNLIKFKFPMESVTPEQFEFINGWSPADITTRKALRSCGWAERNVNGKITSAWAGIISLGEILQSEQAYYQLVNENSPSENFVFAGPINEAIQILSDPNGDGNYTDGFDRRQHLKLFVRTQQRTYASSSIVEIGVSKMTYIAYRFSLTTSVDSNVIVTDSVIENDAQYSSIAVTYFSQTQQRYINGINRNFSIIINGGGCGIKQIYTKLQYLLRQIGDIDQSTSVRVGKVADSLCRFVGDKLFTARSVFIENFNQSDINQLVFTDVLGTEVSYPFVSTCSINFNSNLVNDTDAIYSAYFTSTPAGNYGSGSAVLLEDITGSAVSGKVSGKSNIVFSFNYDANIQGGRTPSTDADITLVAIGLNTGQFVCSTGTITRATGQTFSLVAALDRVYTV